MPGATSTYVTARFLSPDYLVQAQANAISCPLYSGGALVAPSSGTVSVYDSSGQAIVSGAAATITGSIATYSISAGTLPSTLARGMGWRVEWTLIVGGATTVYRNSAGLVRCELKPVVTDSDLFRREGGLDPAGDSPISSLTDFQDYLDEAWTTILGRLAGRGNLPHLVMEPSALRECHLLLTLHLVFEDFRTRLNETHGQKADTYHTRFEAAWSALSFEYDSTDSGRSDGRRKRAATSAVWLGGWD